MAAKKPQPQPKTRSQRERHAPGRPSLGQPAWESLHRHIQAVRGHLMDAEALLDCVRAACSEDDRLDAPGPNYTSVIRIALGYLNTSIDHLDSVNLRAALQSVQASGDELVAPSAEHPREYPGVTESRAAYIH